MIGTGWSSLLKANPGFKVCLQGLVQDAERRGTADELPALLPVLEEQLETATGFYPP